MHATEVERVGDATVGQRDHRAEATLLATLWLVRYDSPSAFVSKQSLLLVDGDTRSMRVLEVSLRKAGFSVTTGVSVQDALDKLELDAPDLIISETTFPDGDGFELRRRVRAVPEWAEIPFIFLTAEAAIENKIRGLELGVDDYLTKPIYIKEIVTRINILLQKRQRARFEERRDGRTRFAGRVTDMPVVDVIQTIEISRKSGVIQFSAERGRQAAIYFRDGRVIDAESGALQGEDAVYRLLTWSEGEFEVIFRTVRRREVIQTSSQGLLMEGMRRLDEWSRLLEQLPSLSHRFEVDTQELAARLGDVPDDNNAILRLIDGKRTLIEVIDNCDVGDLECLQAISRLYFEELLLDLDHAAPVRRDTGKPVPLVEVETPTPIEEVASGPMPAVALPVDEIIAEDAEPADAGDEIIEEEDEPGALMGGYRQSSLRLIDAAVAAAQAIEPSLFDDEVDALLNGPSYTTNGVHDDEGVPQMISQDESNRPGANFRAPGASRSPGLGDQGHENFDIETPPDRPRLGREDSGLRMIGSLGRDRAETSGELTLGAAPLRAETQRELVTILPRRITREMAVVTPPPDVPEAPPSPTPAPTSTPPIEPPTSLLPPPRLINLAGGVRRARGPGRGASLLLALAGFLSLVAVYLYITRSGNRGAGRSPADAQMIVTPIHDASFQPIIDSGWPAADIDALVARAPVDAAVAIPVDAKPAPDINAQAKKLYDDARKAYDESDHEVALQLVDASLKVRRTAGSYILRGQVLQRLGRVDEALAALEAAHPFAAPHRGAKLAAIYEWRARILWSVRRTQEARAAMQEYLNLVAEGRTADQFRKWLDDSQ